MKWFLRQPAGSEPVIDMTGPATTYADRTGCYRSSGLLDAIYDNLSPDEREGITKISSGKYYIVRSD